MLSRAPKATSVPKNGSTRAEEIIRATKMEQHSWGKSLRVSAHNRYTRASLYSSQRSIGRTGRQRISLRPIGCGSTFQRNPATVSSTIPTLRAGGPHCLSLTADCDTRLAKAQRAPSNPPNLHPRPRPPPAQSPHIPAPSLPTTPPTSARPYQNRRGRAQPRLRGVFWAGRESLPSDRIPGTCTGGEFISIGGRIRKRLCC